MSRTNATQAGLLSANAHSRRTNQRLRLGLARRCSNLRQHRHDVGTAATVKPEDLQKICRPGKGEDSLDPLRVLSNALGLPGPDSVFPWQAGLLRNFLDGGLPCSIDIPTGLGKTSVMAIWLVARACGARQPRSQSPFEAGSNKTPILRGPSDLRAVHCRPPHFAANTPTIVSGSKTRRLPPSSWVLWTWLVHGFCLRATAFRGRCARIMRGCLELTRYWCSTKLI